MSDPEPSDTVKKERSAAQLQSLAKARVKAAEVRAKNTELRRKEREVVSAQLAENRRMREESIEREQAAIFNSNPREEEPASDHQPTAPPNSPEEEVVYEKKPRRRSAGSWWCKKAVPKRRSKSNCPSKKISHKLPKSTQHTNALTIACLSSNLTNPQSALHWNPNQLVICHT